MSDTRKPKVGDLVWSKQYGRWGCVVSEQSRTGRYQVNFSFYGIVEASDLIRLPTVQRVRQSFQRAYPLTLRPRPKARKP